MSIKLYLMEKLIFDKNMVIKCKKAKWKKIS